MNTENDDAEYDCNDCGVNTLMTGEYYMLNTAVWLEAMPQRAGMLCITCLETRLGRRVKATDFTKALVNRAPIFGKKSFKLAHRLRK